MTDLLVLGVAAIVFFLFMAIPYILDWGQLGEVSKTSSRELDLRKVEWPHGTRRREVSQIKPMTRDKQETIQFAAVAA